MKLSEMRPMIWVYNVEAINLFEHLVIAKRSPAKLNGTSSA